MTGTGEARFPEFDRRFFESREDFSVIGPGAIGGKALGLASIKRMLESAWPAAEHPEVEAGIPRLTVLATGVFDRFMDENALWDTARSGESDERIAHAFQRAHLPAAFVGDLRALVESVRQPLAVRSSSLLEDALGRPFAGVYATKMTPNDAHEPATRFQRLTEAIKYVYASTFFAGARDYLAVTGGAPAEKMAVVIQEVVGRRHGGRFYPDLAGVARSWNFWAGPGARPEEGVVSLALGLGKTIVDGGLAWSYAPARPRANPPVSSARELLKLTQLKFWAVRMGRPPAYDPVAETEYLEQAGLPEAEADGVLAPLASTYDPASDRLVAGTGAAGARVLTFAPLLHHDLFGVAGAVRALLALAESALGGPAEIEFAATLDGTRERPARIGFLQARPLVAAGEDVEVSEADLAAPGVVVGSGSVLGHGVTEGLADVVYLRPQAFRFAESRRIAAEVEALNHRLVAEGRGYVLVGFGRWGSADPWLGVPVRWAQISGARAIVEAALPHAQADPSQGSHFFHNLTSFGVSYFSVRPHDPRGVDWTWLDARPAAAETEFVRHVRLDAPLRVAVDGRSGRGVIRAGTGEPTT